jgi:hypothetical protein
MFNKNILRIFYTNTAGESIASVKGLHELLGSESVIYANFARKHG